MNALENEGVETTIKKTLSAFTLLIYSLKIRDLDVIHIHWFDPLYIVKYGYEAPLYQRLLTKFLTVLKFLALILDVELTKLFGTKIVWTVHNKYDHDKNHKCVQIIAGWYFTKRINAVDVKCESAEHTIRDLYRIPKSESIYVIPHGNYIGQYKNTVNKETARSELDIEQNSFVFLYFGSMRAYKGLPELIEVYSSLEGMNDSQLLLVGNKRNVRPVRLALREANSLDDVTTIPEYVAEDEVQLYFKAADAVVLPFRNILGSGSTLLALSFGCPLVVRRKGCIPDIVPRTNFLYDSQIKGLRQAMINAYEADSLDEISEQNFARAETLSWSSVAKETKQMYESC
jgi:glycosyltransferase involved in cell wall biosynthesis